MDIKVCDQAIRIASTVLGYNQYKHFLCFGNLLHLIRDKSVQDDHDIDFGMFYEQMDESIISRGFGKFEYKLEKCIINDVDGKAFYLSFKHTGQKGLPPIDVFAWYLHDNIRYHTYDVNFEGKSKPSEYMFKGVEADLLPSPTIPNMKDTRLMRTQFGSLKQPLFTQPVWIPVRYGTLLDRWYPDWLTKRQGQSMSPYVVKMATCKGWLNKTSIDQQLLDSKNKYDVYLKTV